MSEDSESFEELLWEIELLRQENLELRHENTELNVFRCITVIDGKKLRDKISYFIRFIEDTWSTYSEKDASITEKRKILAADIYKVNELIRFLSDDRASTGMFSDIGFALVNAENGIGTPLFTPNKREASGRPPLRMDEQIARAGAILAVEFFIKGRLEQSKAINEVSRRLNWPSGDLIAFRKKITNTKWRDENSDHWNSAISFYEKQFDCANNDLQKALSSGITAEEYWRNIANIAVDQTVANGWTGKRSD